MGVSNISSEEIIKALKETNGLVTLAARKIRCAPNTIYNRAKRVQSVQQAIDDSRAELCDLGELSLRKAVMEGEPWAVSLVLKTLGRTRGYVERQEITGADGQSIDITVCWDGVQHGNGEDQS